MLSMFLAAAAFAGAHAADEQSSGSNFRVYDESIPGWTVVRRNDGCFAYVGDSGGTMTVYYKTTGTSGHAITLIFGSTDWNVREEDVEGYTVRLVGSGNQWNDLNGSTFPGELGGGPAGILSIPFDTSAVAPMLADVAGAQTVRLEHGSEQLLSLSLGQSRRAMDRLIDCVRTVTRDPVPSQSGNDATGPKRPGPA